MATHTEDVNLVELWVRKDTTRWMAGAAAGLFAGLVYWAVGGIFAVSGGGEFWLPIKVAALPILGSAATATGVNMKSIGVGLVAHGSLCAFLGFIFAHFTRTNSLKPLLGMGFTWGAFSWIFINNLFTPSFRDVYAMSLPGGQAFITCLAFGFALASVSFFDRMLRGSR